MSFLSVSFVTHTHTHTHILFFKEKRKKKHLRIILKLRALQKQEVDQIWLAGHSCQAPALQRLNILKRKSDHITLGSNSIKGFLLYSKQTSNSL